MIRMNRGILLAAVLVLGAGCASMPPVAGTPIADVGDLVGTWAGTVTPGDLPFYLTINPGGTLTAPWGPNMTWGPVTTRHGQATFEVQPGASEGSIPLYDEGGTRRLVLHDRGAACKGEGGPQGKPP